MRKGIFALVLAVCMLWVGCSDEAQSHSHYAISSNNDYLNTSPCNTSNNISSGETPTIETYSDYVKSMLDGWSFTVEHQKEYTDDCLFETHLAYLEENKKYYLMSFAKLETDNTDKNCEIMLDVFKKTQEALEYYSGLNGSDGEFYILRIFDSNCNMIIRITNWGIGFNDYVNNQIVWSSDLEQEKYIAFQNSPLLEGYSSKVVEHS